MVPLLFATYFKQSIKFLLQPVQFCLPRSLEKQNILSSRVARSIVWIFSCRRAGVLASKALWQQPLLCPVHSVQPPDIKTTSTQPVPARLLISLWQSFSKVWITYNEIGSQWPPTNHWYSILTTPLQGLPMNWAPKIGVMARCLAQMICCDVAAFRYLMFISTPHQQRYLAFLAALRERHGLLVDFY